MIRLFLSVPELARETKESQAVWRKRIFRREIEHVKLGRNVRVSEESLAAYLLNRVVHIESKRG